MYRQFIAAGLVGCGIAFAASAAVSTPLSWKLTGSGQHYEQQGSGDPRSDPGATVVLRAQQAESGKFGATAIFLDAAPYRGRMLQLSADLDTRDAMQGAAIWLRADDAAHKPIAFANSQQTPVVGTVSAAHREVRIEVPTAASHLVLGTILIGNGEVTARHLRLAVVATPTAAGVTPTAVLDAAIGIVRAHALHAHAVDWERVVPELHAMAKDAKVPVDVYPAIRALLAQLGDHHSFLLAPWQAHQEQVAGGATAPPVVTSKQGGIGFIDMPGYLGMGSDARRTFVASMIDSIGKVAPQVRCGWIVDLREDTGGNMFPMLAGLHPLLGDMPLGGFRDAEGRLSHFSAEDKFEKALPKGPKLEHAAVAVLLGPHTGSSGEVVAVAFRGRPNTRSFGQATAGLSTGNALFGLPDGSMLALTTVVDVDRDGQVYGGKLQPDVPITASDTKEDATLAAAQAWLEQGPGCHG